MKKNFFNDTATTEIYTLSLHDALPIWGLEILRTEDLREELKALRCPFIRFYGYLDGLVPRKVAGLLDAIYPQSPSVIFRNAAHAPFISHPDEFSDVLINACKK